MGTAELILKYVDADSPEAVVHLRDDREDALKSQIIQKNVRMLIVRTLAEFDFEHVDTMLDTLFVEDKMSLDGQVSLDTFKQWIMRDIKVSVTDKDFQLFVKANPALCRPTGLIDKEDLLQIFNEPYR